MKSVARKIMRQAKGFREFWLDMRRYYRFSTPAGVGALGTLEGRQLECQVTKDYHRIEKGLSLRSPRSPFGAAVDHRLSVTVDRAPERPFRQHAEDARRALALWNDTQEIDPQISPSLASVGAPRIAVPELESFFRSRRSVRAFSEVEVPAELVEKAVDLAINTPSVCNRQSWQAHYYVGDAAQRILGLQNGSKSFAHEIPTVIVVTSDNALFSGSGERNQRWIDGGLFAMSLVWSLHGLGVATCMLNWSRVNSASDELRRVARISPSEEIIVMIGVGWPAEEARVARSPRRPVEDVLIRHTN